MLACSRFRDSVNCGASSMENNFLVAKFVFKVRKISSLFCLVQNGAEVIWVACIGISERSKWYSRCARAFLEAFWTYITSWDTQSMWFVHMPFRRKLWNVDIYNLRKKPTRPPHFHDHILTDSLEQAKLDLIHWCQLHWWTSCEHNTPIIYFSQTSCAS